MADTVLPGMTSFLCASITFAPPGTTRFFPTSLKNGFEKETDCKKMCTVEAWWHSC